MSRTSTLWLLVLAAAIGVAPAGTALAQSVSLQQCANGTASSPRACSGSAWITGTVNRKNSHYIEGDATPFRAVLGGFTVGSTGNTVTFQWDTTEAGVHAYDYVESFDHTETLGMGNDPCSGVAGCSLGTFTTGPVPIDPLVSDAGVTQRPGVFVLFGGTITGVSGYQYVGTFAGRSSTAVTVTFTADSPKLVLAWGGHLASSQEWAPLNGASFISGTLQTRLYSLNGKNKSQTQSLSGVGF